MTKKDLDKFLIKLEAEGFFLFAPHNKGPIAKIEEVKNIADIDWSGKIPINTWKGVVLPADEQLFSLNKGKLKASQSSSPMIAGVGINVLDLKALTLFEQVFSRDSYYQKRRRKTLMIGYSAHWPNDYKKYKVFSHKWEEDILEHIVFDIFFVRQKNGQFKVYSGSEKGQVILEELGINNFQHIEFAGAISEKGPDQRMLNLMKKVDKSINKKVWAELNEKCIACGKCTIACPTCFCFNIEDKNDPDTAGRNRKWGNCFYNDFSLVAGGHKDLDTVKKKIYFWYFHKFVRIPKEYSLPGCVGCGRCSFVCPVGIKINEILKKL